MATQLHGFLLLKQSSPHNYHCFCYSQGPVQSAKIDPLLPAHQFSRLFICQYSFSASLVFKRYIESCRAKGMDALGNRWQGRKGYYQPVASVKKNTMALFHKSGRVGDKIRHNLNQGLELTKSALVEPKVTQVISQHFSSIEAVANSN